MPWCPDQALGAPLNQLYRKVVPRFNPKPEQIALSGKPGLFQAIV
jgi:hypothetical protein